MAICWSTLTAFAQQPEVLEYTSISINGISTPIGMHNTKITIFDISGAEIFEQGFTNDGKPTHAHAANVALAPRVYALSFMGDENGVQAEVFMVAH